MYAEFRSPGQAFEGEIHAGDGVWAGDYKGDEGCESEAESDGDLEVW